MEKVISFSSTLENFHTNLWQFHIPIPENIIANWDMTGEKRVVVTLNNSRTYPAALLKSKTYYFILVNKEIKSALRLDEGKSVEVFLQQDNSEFGHSLPEEFEILLDQDEIGADFFYQLTKGKQRSLVYLVSKVKNSNSRLKKALAILSHLKKVKGQLDFKLLQEEIKHYNNLDF